MKKRVVVSALLVAGLPVFAGEWHVGLLTGEIPEVKGSGLVSISVTSQGAYTGKIAFGGGAASFSGTFRGPSPQIGTHRVTLKGFSSSEKVLELTSDTSGITRVVQAQFDAGLRRTLGAARWSASNPCPAAGRFTLALFPDLSPGPRGTGHTAFEISRLGAGTVVWKLGDGQSLTRAILLEEGLEMPLYVPTLDHGRKGMLLGRLYFREEVESDIDGTLNFEKLSAASASAPFASGFSQVLTARGSTFDPVSGVPLISLPFHQPNAVLKFSRTGPLHLAEVWGEWQTSDAFKARSPATGTTIKIARRTGLVSGKTKDYALGQATDAALSGVVLQKTGEVSGYAFARQLSVPMSVQPSTEPPSIFFTDSTSSVTVNPGTAVAGVQQMFDLSASDSAAQFGVVNADALFESWTFDASTGLLHGQPRVTGRRELLVWAEDSFGNRVYRVISFKFPSSSLVITSSAIEDPSIMDDASGYMVEVTPTTLERRMKRGGHHFGSVFVSGQAFVFRPHPGKDANGWGVSWYGSPSFPSNAYMGGRIDSVTTTAGGITVRASGALAAAKGVSYGSWTLDMLFTCNLATKTVDAAGALHIELPAPVAHAPTRARDLNLFKTASNLLWQPSLLLGVPLLDGTLNVTGDMQPVVDIHHDGQTLPFEHWDPRYQNAHFPGDETGELGILMRAEFNQVDTMAQGYRFGIAPAWKPTFSSSIRSTGSPLPLMFGGFYTTGVAQAFYADNIGVNAQIRGYTAAGQSETVFDLELALQSQAHPMDGEGTSFQLAGTYPGKPAVLAVYHARSPDGPFRALTGSLQRVGRGPRYTGMAMVPAPLMGAKNFFIAR